MGSRLLSYCAVGEAFTHSRWPTPQRQGAQLLPPSLQEQSSSIFQSVMQLVKRLSTEKPQN